MRVVTGHVLLGRVSKARHFLCPCNDAFTPRHCVRTAQDDRALTGVFVKQSKQYGDAIEHHILVLYRFNIFCLFSKRRNLDFFSHLFLFVLSLFICDGV